jgi:hypothetical protein
MSAYEYIVDKLFPANDISIISGPHGVGTSTFALQAFDAITDGRPVLDLPSVQTPAVFIACDRPLEALHEHMESLGIDPRLKPSLSLVGQLQRGEDSNLAGVQAILKQAGISARLWFLDGMNALCKGKVTDYNDVSKFLDGAADYCTKNKITVIACIRSCKAKEGNGYTAPLDRVLGPGAWVGQAGCKVMIDYHDAKNLSDSYRIFGVCPRRAKYYYRWGQFTPTGELLPCDAPALAAEPESPLAIWLTTQPEQAEFTLDEAEDALRGLNVSKRTILRWIAAEVESGKLAKVGKGKYRRVSPN